MSADCLFVRFRYNRILMAKLSRWLELTHKAWKVHTYIYSSGL